MRPMFQDSFLANLLVFALGQFAAWGYLRTGLVWRGVFLMVATWVLADVALVARLAYQHGETFLVALVLMQITAVLGCFGFAHGRWRRRRPRRVMARDAAYRSAFVHYLRDRLDQAATELRRLRRADPWDLPVCLGLAFVEARRGATRAATRLFRAALSLDRRRQFADVIADGLRDIRAATVAEAREKARPASAARTRVSDGPRGSGKEGRESGEAFGNRTRQDQGAP
jgi:hypothetical protein